VPKRSVPPIPGPRVRLRLVEPDDLPRTLAWRNQDQVRQWFVHSAVLTWEQHEGWYRKYLDRDDDSLFLIEETDRLHKPIGQVSLYKLDWRVGSAEFGRILIGEPDAHGAGYAHEATAVLLDFAFRDWGLREVYLEVFAHNARAIRVYEQCGFRPGPEAGGLVPMRVTSAAFAASAWGDPWAARRRASA
jgi:RimJ/RimL family protein N-acetyltransferase